MQRRALLKNGLLLLGGIAVSPDLLARALANPAPILARVPADRVTLLAEMADTILPETDTPGAKAAKVHEYITIVVEECFAPTRRQPFWDGLEATDRQCVMMHGQSFISCSGAERTSFFQKLQSEQSEQGTFWFQLKSLTLSGYFSSEIGASQALAYDPIPGGWIPDMKTDANTKAWTPMF
jgi:hypothetical protein